MKKKKLSVRKIIDTGLLIFILCLLFFPTLRLPVLGNFQRILLQTGLFNASIDQNDSNKSIDLSLELQTVDGRIVNTKDWKDKVVFINIWATWCPPCLAEMPNIATLYQDTQNDVEFVLISVDKDREKARDWIDKKQYPVPVYFLKDNLPDALSYQAIPTTWIIDTKGTVRYQHSGLTNYATSSFKEFLLSL